MSSEIENLIKEASAAGLARADKVLATRQSAEEGAQKASASVEKKGPEQEIRATLQEQKKVWIGRIESASTQEQLNAITTEAFNQNGKYVFLPGFVVGKFLIDLFATHPSLSDEVKKRLEDEAFKFQEEIEAVYLAKKESFSHPAGEAGKDVDTSGVGINFRKAKKQKTTPAAATADAGKAIESDNEKEMNAELLKLKEKWLEIIRLAQSSEELAINLTAGDFSFTGEDFMAVLKKYALSSEEEKRAHDKAFDFLREVKNAYKYRMAELETLEAKKAEEGVKGPAVISGAGAPSFRERLSQTEIDELLGPSGKDKGSDDARLKTLFASFGSKDAPKDSAEAGGWTVKKLLEKIPDKTEFSVQEADGTKRTFRRDGDKFVTTAKKPAKANGAVISILTHGGKLVTEDEPVPAPALNPDGIEPSLGMSDEERRREAENEKKIEEELLARKKQLLDIIHGANSTAELEEGLESVHFSFTGDGFLALLKKYPFASPEREAYFYEEAGKFLREVEFAYNNKKTILKEVEEAEPTEAEKRVKVLDAEIEELEGKEGKGGLIAELRAKYVKEDHEISSLLYRLKNIFGRGVGQDADRPNKDAYLKQLAVLKEKKLERLRVQGNTGQDLKKEMEGLSRYFKLDESVNLINERAQYKAKNQSFPEKIVNVLGDLGRAYNRIPLKKKLLLTGAFAGITIATTLSGGTAIGALAVTLVTARRIAAGLGTAVGTEALLESFGERGRVSKAEKEIQEQLARINIDQRKEETLTTEEINRKYFSYQDANISKEEKQRALEYTGNEGNTEKYSNALLELFEKYGKEVVERKARAMKDSCLSELDLLGIVPTPYAFSETWALWDIAKQYYFFTHPEENDPKYSLANPLEDSQKMDEIINRHIGWEVYALYHGGNKNFLSHVNSDNLEVIKEYLSRPAKENGTLSSRELALLGFFSRTSSADFHPEEEMVETKESKRQEYLRKLDRNLQKDIALLDVKLQSEKKAKIWRKVGAAGFGALVGSGWLTRVAMDHLGGHVVVDWAKDHWNVVSGGHPDVAPRQLTPTQIWAERELATPLDKPASIFPEPGTGQGAQPGLSPMTDSVDRLHGSGAAPNAPSAVSLEELKKEDIAIEIHEFLNTEAVVPSGSSIDKMLMEQAKILGLTDPAEQTRFAVGLRHIIEEKLGSMSGEELKAVGIPSGDVSNIRAGATIHWGELLDRIGVDEALSDANGLSPEKIASITSNNAEINEYVQSHHGTTLTDGKVDDILHGNAADAVSHQSGVNGGEGTDLTQAYDGGMEGETGETVATPDAERGSIRSADIQYDKDIVLGKTFNLKDYVDYFNQHPESFTQFQKIDTDYKKFISLGNADTLQEMKGKTVRGISNLKDTPLGKFVEMSRKTYGIKLGMPSAKEKVYEYMTRIAMIGIEHPKGAIRFPQSI